MELHDVKGVEFIIALTIVFLRYSISLLIETFLVTS